MTKALELATAFATQRPLLAQAYLWTFIAFTLLCFIMGCYDHRKEIKCFFIKSRARKSS